MITCRVYHDGKLEKEGFDPQEVSDHLEHGDLVWLDVLEPTDEEIALCQKEFSLHPEAVEDVRERNQRTKVDLYEGYFVMVAYGVAGGPSGIETHEVHVFAGRNFLLTFRFDPPFDLGQVLHRWDASPEITSHGGGALLHFLLDEIIDSYFPVVEAFDEAVDRLEDRVFAEAVEAGLQHDLFRLKKGLVDFRRFVLPLRDVLDFMQEDTLVVTPPLKPYFRDVYDNVYRAIEFVDNTRETLTIGLGAYQAAVGNQLNVIMKKLTAWAAILLVPTLIAGIYGMNFEHMPEIPTRYGYFVTIGVMLGVCTLLYRSFKKRDWL